MVLNMIHQFDKYTPDIANDVWIAPSAEVIGRVSLEKDVAIFFHSVIRGDSEVIHIQEGTNIQDNCTLHADAGYPLRIGKHVSVGHNCILHGCHIEAECLIGMGAIVMDGVHIEAHCIIGAGALLTENMHIPKGSVVVGVPGRVVKHCSDLQLQSIRENAQHYIELAKTYQKEEE